MTTCSNHNHQLASQAGERGSIRGKLVCEGCEENLGDSEITSKSIKWDSQLCYSCSKITEFSNVKILKCDEPIFFCSQECYDRITDPNFEEQLKNFLFFFTISHRELILKFSTWEKRINLNKCQNCELKFNFGGEFSIKPQVSFVVNNYHFSEEQKREMKSRFSKLIPEDLSFSVAEFLEYPVLEFCTETCFYSFCGGMESTLQLKDFDDL